MIRKRRIHPYNAKAMQRLMALVEITDDCWFFIGSLNSDGYGNFQYKGKSDKAHRVSWKIHNGPIPEGMHVLHRCDNPACVRPDHLFLGTHQYNMADRDRKKRASGGRKIGERNNFAKITEAEVKAIRRDTRRLVDIAPEYGLSISAVGFIKQRKTWRHVS